MPERKPIQPDAPVADSLRREPLPPCRHYLSTGCTLLDLAVSDRYPGGVGSGRVVQLIGDNSTAKSVIMHEILGAAQRLGGYALEEDAEYTPDFLRSELFGLSVGHWKDDGVQEAALGKGLADVLGVDDHYCYRNPQTIEEVFDGEIGVAVQALSGVVQDGKKQRGVKPILGPLAIGVDTFTALPSNQEQEDSLDQASYRMERAKKMSAGFRKWLGQVARNDVTIVAVDHIRDAVGVTFGPKWTTSGGLALQQYSSTRIFLAHAGDVKNGSDRVIGVKIRAKVVKNKIAPPGREVTFHVLFDYGIDDIRTNLEWLVEQKETCLLTQGGSWYSWGEDKLGNGMDAAVLGVEKQNKQAAVRAEVARVWKEVYAAAERAPKERGV